MTNIYFSMKKKEGGSNEQCPSENEKVLSFFKQKYEILYKYRNIIFNES